MNEVQSVDNAIGQVERLYRTVTGRDVPAVREEPYAVIPPEKAPEEHVQEQVDRLMDKLAEVSGNTTSSSEWKPPVSMWENRNEAVISVDLPGVARDAIQVAVNRGLLEITGSRPLRFSHDGEQLDLRYSEHPHGRFRRTVPLPPGTNQEQVQAQMRSGVLEVRISKESMTGDAKPIHVA